MTTPEFSEPKPESNRLGISYSSPDSVEDEMQDLIHTLDSARQLPPHILDSFLDIAIDLSKIKSVE